MATKTTKRALTVITAESSPSRRSCSLARKVRRRTRFRNRPRYKAHLPSEHDPNQSNRQGRQHYCQQCGCTHHAEYVLVVSDGLSVGLQGSR